MNWRGAVLKATYLKLLSTEDNLSDWLSLV